MFDIPNPDAEPGTIAVIVKVGDLSQALSESVHCWRPDSLRATHWEETQASLHVAIHISFLRDLLVY